MKKPLAILPLLFSLSISSFSQTNVDAGPRNEVFRQTILVPTAANLSDPWEITYGPDDSLWITEAKGYRVKKVSPINGGQRTILDISNGSIFLPLADRPFNAQFSIASNNPQGGLMGMAIHPNFNNPTTPKRYVYIAYVHTFVTTVTSPSNGGVIYTNRLVRFTYNPSTNRLESPVALCDTLPGSSDHNSGRLIIAPVGNTMYLFYAAGDMGAGQFGNANRANKAQEVGPYEGKILRFNLEPDGDADAYEKWIPSGTGVHKNPYNGTGSIDQSAIWAIGIRNNQGFAFVNGKLYGSSHGPFSDDEINWLRAGKNYGHPLVIGDSTDGNYDGAKAGPASSSLPLIGSEGDNAFAMKDPSNNHNYSNPIFSFYPAPRGNTSTPWSIQYIYNDVDIDGAGSGTTTALNANGSWASEAISGMQGYTNSMIPGWKNSLLIGCLKGGRIIRLNLNAAGDSTAPNHNTSDTTTLFRSVNRFRDMALSPDGQSLFVVIDSSATTSGPTTVNPIVSACSGCLQKYTFLGYNAGGTSPFASAIPTSIKIAAAIANGCENANYVVINAANNNTNIWVPITDTNSNVVAEIYANGQDLDTVRTSLYRHSGATRREDASKHMYLDRNITITPDNQPGSAVRIRLYITNAEFNSLNTATNSLGQPSGLGGSINNLGIFKNNVNTCSGSITGGSAAPVTSISKVAHGSFGYVLQSNTLPSFSTFYFANSSLTTLPVRLLSFTGSLINNNATLLTWVTGNEVNTANFEIERSIDGNSYDKIGTVAASGTSSSETNYSYTDNDVATTG
jgi:PQQ-dependent dehydrogenase (s-GDH family)